MSKTHHSPILHIFRMSSLLGGIALLTTSSRGSLNAQLIASGPGTSVTQAPELNTELMLQQGSLHPAAMEAAGFNPALFLGMVLVLLALGIHVIIVVRSGKEHIHRIRPQRKRWNLLSVRIWKR